jgi:predicted RecB family nuclease
MRREKDVKAAVRRILDQAGAYFFMPVPTGYGRHGIPDFIVCQKGRFIAVETKFGDRRPTKYQELELQKIQAAGGIALVINEFNLDTLKKVLIP